MKIQFFATKIKYNFHILPTIEIEKLTETGIFIAFKIFKFQAGFYITK